MPDQTFTTRTAVETVLASAQRTASGNTSTLPGFDGATVLRGQVNVTAVTGVAPTLDVVLEDSLDGGTTWNTVGTFTQATAVTRQVLNVTLPFGPLLRVRWTVAGTSPSFTFAVILLSK